MSARHLRVRALDRARTPLPGGLWALGCASVLAFLLGALVALLTVWVR